MGKTVRTVVGLAAVAAIAVFAPEIAPALLAALGTSTATALAVSAVTLGLTLAGTIAVTAALNAIMPPPSARNAAAALQMLRQSITDSFIIYGMRRAGGVLAFYHPKKDGDGKNWRYFIVAHAGHRCQGVIGWYLNDEQVTVDGSGKVTSGAYANHAWLWFERGGIDAVAHATFVTECEGYWTDEHVGFGVAKTYAKFEMVDDVVQAGMPTITAIIEGKDDIRDPRTGGVGYTRLATPIIYDWFAMPREEGGFGAEPDELPDDTVLSAWTNICDEDVAIPGGTEKRYELDCWITTGGAPSELRQTFTTCVAGTYAAVEGRFMLRPGYWVPVSQTLREDDLAAAFVVPVLGDPQGLATEVSGTFIDPANNYQSMPVPTRTRDSDDVEQADYDLPHVTSSFRGERILEIMLRRAGCERRVTWPMNIAGIAVSAMDTASIDTARYGLNNYAFVVDGWALSQDFGVNLQLREENEEIYSDALTYGTAAVAPTLAIAQPVEDGALLALQLQVTEQGTTIGGQTSELGVHSTKLDDLKARLDAAGIPDV